MFIDDTLYCIHTRRVSADGRWIHKERTLKTSFHSDFIRRPWWFLGAALWVAMVAIGFGMTWSYSSSEGIATDAPAVWPAASHLHRASDRHTLVMFVHAHCSCSRASLTELARTLDRLRDRVSAIVVFIRPEGVEPDLVEIGLRAQAASLHDTVVVEDDQHEADLFGAHTSGATLLFDAAGIILFAGGLTAIRGHEGDSYGQERIVALVSSGATERADSPVFGCALTSKEGSR
jgi:hypothetical protein